MKHQPELFNARNLRYDTRLLVKLKLLLGTICAYEGEIPLSEKEIADRLKTSTYRVRLLLKKLEHEKVVHYDHDGKLFFNYYQYVQEKEEYTKQDLYSKNFAFYTCEEFLNEDINVQRFVFHAVGYKLVYLPSTFYWENVDALYGDAGLLNLRCRKEALEVIDKASKYLIIHLSKNKNNFKVTGVHKKWLDMGEVHSEGALLWIKKKLEQHRFCIEFISKKAMIQLAKVMEYYYSTFGYEFSTEVFDVALRKIQEDPSRSNTFYNMIYEEEENLSESRLDEISAYFRSIMQSSELIYAEDLNNEYNSLCQTKHTAELNLFKNNQLVRENNSLIHKCDKKMNLITSKLGEIAKGWRKRVNTDPQWLLKNKDKIIALPIPFYNLRWDIEELEKKRNTTPFSDPLADLLHDPTKDDEFDITELWG